MTAELGPYPRYKDSGVEWLGPVPENWQLWRGKRAFEKADRPVRPDDEVITCFRDGQVTLRRLRRTQGFTEAIEETGYQGIRTGDLVIHQMDAFAGAVGVADADGKGSPVYAVCVPRVPAVLPDYFKRVVREMALRGWIAALAKGIRERSTDFRFDTFGQQVLPVPPFEEQKTIVRYLDHIGAQILHFIEAKERLIELLEEEKQAVIHRVVTRGLDPDVPRKPSGVDWLGDVPEHWDVVALGALTRMIQTGPFGSQLHASDYVAGGLPVINPSHLKGGQIVPDHEVAVSPEKATELGRHRLQVDDLVTARRGELGRAGVVSTAEEGWICGTGSMLVRPRQDSLSTAFLNAVFQSPKAREALTSSSVGATMDNLNEGMLSRLRIGVPPLPEQAANVTFIRQTDAVHQAVAARARTQIELVRGYRTRLIADVVTGKLDVRRATQTVAADLDEEAFILDEQHSAART